jgi:hypothetical protein
LPKTLFGVGVGDSAKSRLLKKRETTYVLNPPTVKTAKALVTGRLFRRPDIVSAMSGIAV